ncbi:hypothetical protein BJY01DRAFT_204737 [Aspergillus pseudoustus]|uniref:Uncharacterized protein n=1 Tax=Aspergillus pseudoustus TaxID=1810923 RepID=A0ABR4KT64_9EURO
MQQVTNLFKGKQPANATAQTRRRSHDPVLTAEDEAFLRNVTSEGEKEGVGSGAGAGSGAGEQSAPPATPPGPVSPVSPVEEFGRELGEQERRNSIVDAGNTADEKPESATKGKERRGSSPEKKKKRPWSFIWKKGDKKTLESESTTTPESSTPKDTATLDDKETKQENEDMTEILDRLNLAADNNKVFSISDETQELLRKFKLIFKDLINGVPTAYHDLEMLLTNGNRQLQDTYSNLPSFLQKLIEKLPERWTETLAPEMLAVAAERASQSGVNVENIGKAAAAANKMGLQIPSLKELVGKPAAIVGMLRSIMAFLRARFPAVLGMNVLWSLALFILLFVLWYCHKRGREVRLENERLVTEEEIEKMNQASSGGTTPQIRSTETLTTTAAQGASIEEVRQGIKDAQKSREDKTPASDSASASAAARSENKEAEDDSVKPAGVENEPIKPTRSKSILSIFGRRDSAVSTPSTSKVAPYPGT